MIIKDEILDLCGFRAWLGAVDTQDKICNAGKGEAFVRELSQIYPDGIGRTELNDILWFDSEYCLSLVGLGSEGNDPEATEAEDGEEIFR